MLSFLVGLICGASIAFPIYAVLCGASKEQPVPRAGPRLPHHRRNVASLPEWQEHQRDVDHLEGVSNEPGHLKFPEWTPENIDRLARFSRDSRDEAFWLGEKK